MRKFCNQCGHAFGDSQETVCPDCGSDRNAPDTPPAPASVHPLSMLKLSPGPEYVPVDETRTVLAKKSHSVCGTNGFDGSDSIYLTRGADGSLQAETMSSYPRRGIRSHKVYPAPEDTWDKLLAILDACRPQLCEFGANHPGFMMQGGSDFFIVLDGDRYVTLPCNFLIDGESAYVKALRLITDLTTSGRGELKCPFCDTPLNLFMGGGYICPSCNARFADEKPSSGGFPMPPAPPPPPKPVMPTDSGMKCPHCGGIVNGLACFCTRCGARLSKI